MCVNTKQGSMGKYILEEFFEKTDAECPHRLHVREGTWTSIIRRAQEDRLLCVNPTNHGENIIVKPSRYPDEIAGEPVFINGLSFNRNLEKIPIYVKIVGQYHGTYWGEIPETDSWPDPIKDNSDSLFETERQESIDWEGTPQKSGSAGADERQKILSEDDVRGSKNDLIK